MRKLSIGGLLAGLLLATGVGLATPAQAAPSLTPGGGQVVVTGLGANEWVVFCASNVAGSDCGPNVLELYSATQDGTYSEGTSVTATGPTTVALPAGTYTVAIIDISTIPPGSVTSQTNVTIGSGGGGGTSSESTPQPQTLTLSINTVEGSSCRQSSVSGIAGTWIDLPAADDCTPPASKAGATLLGWATNPNFPVDIAQRQIDNGWGAYQMLNGEERITAVFIPAGGPTLLSGDGNLFAIWSE